MHNICILPIVYSHVFVSSFAVVDGAAYLPRRFSESISLALEGKIRVMTIFPAYVATDMTQCALPCSLSLLCMKPAESVPVYGCVLACKVHACM